MNEYYRLGFDELDRRHREEDEEERFCESCHDEFVDSLCDLDWDETAKIAVSLTSSCTDQQFLDSISKLTTGRRIKRLIEYFVKHGNYNALPLAFVEAKEKIYTNIRDSYEDSFFDEPEPDFDY